MKSTENFGLNLWELQDLVRMEDFNRDNEKLESALSALSKGGGMKTYTSTSGGDGATGAGISTYAVQGWEKWTAAALIVAPRNFQGTSVTHCLSASSSSSNCGVQFQSPTPGAVYLFLPKKDPEAMLQGVFLSTDMVRFFQGTQSFQNLTHIRVWPASGGLGDLDYVWIFIP